MPYFPPPQAMDLYYHSESDPDSYCCPGDNSKSAARCFVFPYFLPFLLLSPYVFLSVTPEDKLLCYLSPSSPAHQSLVIFSLYYLHFCLFLPSIQNDLLQFILCLSLLFVISFQSKPDGLWEQNDSACTNKHTHTNFTLRYHSPL